MEKANHVAAQRFWRTLPDDVTAEQAQATAGHLVHARGDVRMRATADGKATVATVAATRAAAPGAGGAVPGHRDGRRGPSRAQALVVLPRQPLLASPPELARAAVTVGLPVGASHLDIATSGRDRDRPARPGRRRGRGDGPRPRPRHRPGTRGDGRGHPGRAAPPQAAHPTRARRPRRRGRPARRGRQSPPSSDRATRPPRPSSTWPVTPPPPAAATP